MPNCSRRARFSRATCSCPPNIKDMVRRPIRIGLKIQAQGVSAWLMKNQPPTRQMDFGEAQAFTPVRQTRNGGGLASESISPLLDLEDPSRSIRPTSNSERNSESD